jgi:hypothetical protein
MPTLGDFRDIEVTMRVNAIDNIGDLSTMRIGRKLPRRQPIIIVDERLPCGDTRPETFTVILLGLQRGNVQDATIQDRDACPPRFWL